MPKLAQLITRFSLELFKFLGKLEAHPLLKNKYNIMPTKTCSRTSLLTILLLLSCLMLSYFSLLTPEVIGRDATKDEFSAERALERLDNILLPNHQPHPVNSKANNLVRENIIQQLQGLGLNTEVQDTISCRNDRQSLTCSRVHNIITKMEGSDSANTVLLMAHYDSVPASPGAADASHAVAIIIELLDSLKQQNIYKNDLIVLINEGEEFGLLGARAFMEQHPLAESVDVVINLEARGNQGKSILFETGENNYRLMRLYQQYAKSPLSNSMTYEIYKLLPNDTDLTVMKQHGKTGVNFAFQDRLSHYHTPLDNRDNLSPGSVQHQGDNVYAMLKALLNTDLESLPEGNAVYTDILSGFMIIWPDYMTLPLCIFALLLLILIGWQLLKKQQVKATQLALILPFSLSVLLLSATGCWLLLSVVQYLSGLSQPWLSNPVPMRIAIWLLPFSISLFLANRYQARLGFWGITLSGYSLLLCLSFAASFNMPGLSYLPLLPLLLFAVLLALLCINNKAENQLLIKMVLMISLVAMAVLVFPNMMLLEDAMGLSVAPVFGLFESLIVLLALPLLITGSQTLQKRIIYTTAVCCLLGVFISSQQGGFSKQQPQKLNFEYLQQGDTASIQALSRSALPDKMIAESAFSEQQKISRPWSKAQFPSIKSESLGLPEPSLELITSTVTDGNKSIRLRYQSGRESSQFLLYSKQDARLQHINISGQSYEVPALLDTQYFFCTGIDCNNLEFTLTVSGEQPLALGLVDYSFNLPAALGYLNRIRGDSAQPVQYGDVSLVHKQFRY